MSLARPIFITPPGWPPPACPPPAVTASGAMKFTVPMLQSRTMFVVSFLIVFAMPKSISFSVPSTMRKLAGFKSECTMRSSWIVFTASSIWLQYRRMKSRSSIVSAAIFSAVHPFALAILDFFSRRRERSRARSTSPYSSTMNSSISLGMYSYAISCTMCSFPLSRCNNFTSSRNPFIVETSCCSLLR